MFKSAGAAEVAVVSRSEGAQQHTRATGSAAGAVSRTSTHMMDNRDRDKGLADGAILRPGGPQKAGRSASGVPQDGWAVPPRVLLVDDDAVYRKLTSRFLLALACTIDVAVDGAGAVNKVNLEKYDLVLMDIVMPKLDGVSATTLIRQFDLKTPIIATTSNSKPHEVAIYYSRGMQDVLPKPFTKDSLLTVLEKHLTHLKHITRPIAAPSIDIHQLSAQFDQSLVIKSMSSPASNKSGVKIKLRASTSLSDAGVLHDIIDDDESIKVQHKPRPT
ncbi:hypothetical protein M0805_002693 [Coniferiporia weirii]|nr:hypothetical protein M0805_002693 [Coniferiporia weirii]